MLNTHFKSSLEPITITQQLEEPALISAQQPSQLTYILIGQLLATYIIIETTQGAVLIDQHAAHERIIYERIKQQFNTVERVKLLFAQVISITKNDMDLLVEHLPLFEIFGVLIQQVSATELIVQETPVYLKNQSLQDIIQQTIGWLHELHQVEPHILQKRLQEQIHAQMSCKAAVKAGDQLTTESMHEIIKNLYALENNTTCPHGRPTIWALSQYEIEKKFKRNYK